MSAADGLGIFIWHLLGHGGGTSEDSVMLVPSGRIAIERMSQEKRIRPARIVFRIAGRN
jgi:hypothetical protein